MLPSARRVWDAATRAMAQVTDGPYGIPREAFGGMVAQTPAQARGVMGAVRALNEAIIVQGSRSLDAAGEAARAARTAAGTPAASGPGKVVIDLFGGRTSQIPGAINIDRRNQQRLGAQALVPDPRQPAARVRFAPIKDGIADDVFAIGPRAPFLDEAHRILKPGGRLTVVGTRRNEYRHLPDDLTLQNKGFRIIQRDGPLPPELERYTFRFSNDRPIEFGKQFTTILEKVR